jgi:hypothetical protein
MSITSEITILTSELGFNNAEIRHCARTLRGYVGNLVKNGDLGEIEKATIDRLLDRINESTKRIGE